MFVWFAFEVFDIIDVPLNSLPRGLAVPRCNVPKGFVHHSQLDISRTIALSASSSTFFAEPLDEVQLLTRSPWLFGFLCRTLVWGRRVNRPRRALRRKRPIEKHPEPDKPHQSGEHVLAYDGGTVRRRDVEQEEIHSAKRKPDNPHGYLTTLLVLHITPQSFEAEDYPEARNRVHQWWIVVLHVVDVVYANFHWTEHYVGHCVD